MPFAEGRNRSTKRVVDVLHCSHSYCAVLGSLGALNRWLATASINFSTHLWRTGQIWHFSSQNNRTLWSVVLEQNEVANLKFDLGPYLAAKKGNVTPI
jgi:hypothetical protein